MSFSAFILDDEPKAQSNLLDALGRHPCWRSLRSYSSGENLIEEVVKYRPNVVFLDIQMPGENGLDLARKLLELRDPPLIVFVTAYSDYAVDAFELYALDYLLKPFDDERVAQCVGKLNNALNNGAEYQVFQQSQHAWATTKPLDKIVIKSSNALRIIPTKNIHWLAANGNYVDIHHNEGKHLLRGSLKNVILSLSSDDFIQVHRGFVVRQSLIREFKTLEDERSNITLVCGNVLPVGKSYRQALVRVLSA